MSVVTSPDLLADEPVFTGTTEVFIDVRARRIRLSVCGHLTPDGVSFRTLYSFLKEQWYYDPHGKGLPQFPFPIRWLDDSYTAATLSGGWEFYDDDTRRLVYDWVSISSQSGFLDNLAEDPDAVITFYINQVKHDT